MTVRHRIAVMVFTTCLMAFPVKGSTEVAIGTRLLSAEPFVTAVRPVKVVRPQTVAFDWLANGKTADLAGKSIAAQKRNRVITGQGSWICSPAGFGKRSRCYAG